MELTYSQLKCRDVINVADGKCLGRITDIKFRFPEGVISGIFVPGRKVYGFRLFDRSQVFIEENKIIRIGGDVILVNLRGSESSCPSVDVGQGKPNKRPPKPPHCPPPCPPPCPPSCDGRYPSAERLFGGDGDGDADEF